LHSVLFRSSSWMNCVSDFLTADFYAFTKAITRATTRLTAVAACSVHDSGGKRLTISSFFR
jgi:hypothetical protein